MHRRFNRTQRNYIIAGLCMILVIMGVGYAAFASQLKINGTSSVTGNFLVKITSITPTDIVGNAEDKPEVTTHTDTTATFGTSLQSPGDSITYNIVIENQGNIDAVLKTINKTDATNSAILFETSGVKEGDELLHGETATMKVKVTYNPNVTSQPESLESTLNMTLDYAQVGTEVVPGTNNILLGGKTVSLVDSGDGLYADEYEAGRYVYRGTNPDNYIMFNDELWRIIAKEADGTYKIVKNESIGTMMWDESNSNNWMRPATLNVYLNENYLNSITTNSDKIISHNFNIGAVIGNSDDLYNQIVQEGKVVWYGKIGLISISEYIRANYNIEQCGTIKLNNLNRAICIATNWMQNLIPLGSYMWTITAGTSNENYVFSINGNGGNAGYIYNSNNNANLSNSIVVSALYLSSDIILTGDGSQSNPYVIVD